MTAVEGRERERSLMVTDAIAVTLDEKKGERGVGAEGRAGVKGGGGSAREGREGKSKGWYGK